MANESVLVKAIQRMVKKTDQSIWVFKVVGNPYQMSGVPDLLLCVNGLLVGMEVKAPRPGESLDHARGRATVQQLAVIDDLHRAGAMAEVVCSVEEAQDLLDRARNFSSQDLHS